MSRLYLRMYLALLGSLIAFAVGAASLWHAYGGPVPRHSHSAMLTLLLVLAGAVALAAFPIVRYLSRRLERLQLGAEAWAAGDLTVRVPVEGKDEIASLAASFNHAAARIEQLVGAHKLLLAQASHELRTPVTRIRLAMELIKDIDPRRKEGLEADIRELDRLVEDILLASRLDAIAGLERSEDVDLLALVAEECARYGIDELDAGPAQVQGDPRLLVRLVRNLLENARRHGRPPIIVRLRATPQAIELAVADQGPVIPESDRERLFTPFYRSGNTQGHGLGLSLVRQIARQHGGDARYGQIDDEAATGFIVTLPAPVSPSR